MKRYLMLVICLVAFVAVACGDADSKAKGKVVGGTGGGTGGTGGNGGIDFDEDTGGTRGTGSFEGTAEQAIFGSSVLRDESGSEVGRITALLLNDTVDVCPSVPRSCDGFVPDIGEAYMAAILIGPAELPTGNFDIELDADEEAALDGWLSAEVRLVNYDEFGETQTAPAVDGQVSLTTLTSTSARGEIFADFGNGDVRLDFDADECPAITFFLSNCI